MTAILGLNAYHGDAAAALVVDGELVCAAEEERFNRVKHCAGFPAQAAAWCLAEGGLTAGDLEHVAIGRDPRANLGAKVLRTLLTGTSPSYVKARLQNASRVRDVKGELESALGAGGRRRAAPRRAPPGARRLGLLRLAVRGCGRPDARRLRRLRLDDAGGGPRLVVQGARPRALPALPRDLLHRGHAVARLPELRRRGQGDGPRALRHAALPRGDALGRPGEGRPVRARARLLPAPQGRSGHDLGRRHSVDRSHLLRAHGGASSARHAIPDEPLTSLHEDVAASLQARLEEVYLHLVARLAARTGSPNICLAGGVALNAVANGRIRPETPFEEVFVQPAAGDSGIAVGAAFHVWHQEPGAAARLRHGARVLGPGLRRRRVRRGAAQRPGLEAERLDDDDLVARVAERIAAGDVVGWFQGRMEYGPRALGNRSIVADPRRPDMKDILNARIKHREPFRPFAPSILAEQTGEWFEQDYTSPYMVLVYKTRAEKRELIPAVNHVDDTGRVQTVTREANARYHRLIEEFARQTGVPILLNTSFNENEPVVMSPEQAIDTFLKTKMDLLVLGNSVVRRSGRSADDAAEPAALGGQVEAQR